ncbi:MAG: bifunctional diaminohydroxyphosphoribosylaminopyrimidine deaminase/5-amino-6-(5-phosphoribosylamino)uracil reductase RibD [Syntrophomonadaceae bacterium]|nr:bifunctional diaminohydroxyphosphoribosylaminopyrimidine deaminase/5-amino-6-(5-phosphoribosylamino)uracil reductase RibD [Syntrophomonadaceae bacterium]
MQKALELAAQAQGRTNPNPMVGAVIVREGRIIGEGYHHKAGTPHAEVHALNAAGKNAAGSTLYVTLEPCSHFGRTPPCADAVIAAGIKRVVIATVDPNPKVAGEGIRKLQAAGIEVEVGLMEGAAQRLNEVFFKYIKTGLPFVSLKTAMSLDGKIATYNGDSKWVTSDTARHYVHKLRNIYDGIMVGIGTVLKDDPRLNTRLDEANLRDPIRIIIDGNLDLPLESNIGRTAEEQPTMVFCSESADLNRKLELESRGIEIHSLKCDPECIPLVRVIEKLGEFKIYSLLIEGGGEINASLLEEGLVDKVYWFVAPKIIGGRTAPSPVGGQGIEQMQDALTLTSVEVRRLAEDVLITGYIKEWF